MPKPMDADEEEALVAHLIKIGFRPAPDAESYRGGAVSLHHSDGVYFNLAPPNSPFPRDVQLIIVGRMQDTPLELAEMIGGWVVKTEFLPLVPDQSTKERQMLIDRSFISATIRSVYDADCPGHQ